MNDRLNILENFRKVKKMSESPAKTFAPHNPKIILKRKHLDSPSLQPKCPSTEGNRKKLIEILQIKTKEQRNKKNLPRGY